MIFELRQFNKTLLKFENYFLFKDSIREYIPRDF